MARFVLLIQFTDKGIANIKDSPNRAGAFQALAAKAGVTVESHYWLMGEYDGMLVLTAPTEEKIASLVLHLGSLGFVRTCLHRAFDENEMKAILKEV